MAKKSTPSKPPLRRRDATGHLDPKYAADLRALSRESTPPPGDDVAFLRHARSADSLAEGLGEEFVETATSGEHEGEDVLDQVVPEESGGPFVETTSKVEFARGHDASNPRGATREPFPKT